MGDQRVLTDSFDSTIENDFERKDSPPTLTDNRLSLDWREDSLKLSEATRTAARFHHHCRAVRPIRPATEEVSPCQSFREMQSRHRRQTNAG
jgi:hypothetical protein